VTEGDNSGKAVLRIAAASRIKLFIRPDGLRPAVDKAPAEMRFRRR
jgi:fimbrial chaperone protein